MNAIAIMGEGNGPGKRRKAKKVEEKVVKTKKQEWGIGRKRDRKWLRIKKINAVSRRNMDIGKTKLKRIPGGKLGKFSQI